MKNYTQNLQRFTAVHLPAAVAPIVPSWHACGTRAAVAAAVAGAAQGVAVLTRGTGFTGVNTVVGDKRTTTRMVDPATSSPPV